MFKKIIITIALSTAAAVGWSQTTLSDILQSVERNNVSLQAARENVKAQSLEARVGNSLEDLTISYDHLWGSGNGLGQNGELTVSQEFLFPTVYARRNKLAGNMALRYENEYLDLRQQTLLEAKVLFIELQSLYKREKLLKSRLSSNTYLQKLYDKRYEEGDATVLDKMRIDNELLILRETMSECRMRMIELEKRLRSLNGGEELDIQPIDEPMESYRSYDETLSDYETYAPQLLSYKLRQEGSELDLRLSRSKAIPKIELGYRHEYGTAERDRFNGVTTSLSIPLFSNRHNVKRAQAARTAAVLEAQAATIECASTLSELYAKAELLKETLSEYEGLHAQDDYYRVLKKALDGGEITITEYFAEIYALYDVIESRYRIETEYRTVIASINMIYL